MSVVVATLRKIFFFVSFHQRLTVEHSIPTATPAPPHYYKVPPMPWSTAELLFVVGGGCNALDVVPDFYSNLGGWKPPDQPL